MTRFGGAFGAILEHQAHMWPKPSRVTVAGRNSGLIVEGSFQDLWDPLSGGGGLRGRLLG